MPEEIKEEIAPSDETQGEEDKKQDTQDTLATVNAAWEEKMTAIVADYDKKIAERDAVIKQLITGKSDSEPTDGIAEKINRRRQYKKW